MKKFIPLYKVNLPTNIDQKLKLVLESGFISEGPKAKEFQENLQAWLGNPYTAIVNSGTAALTLAGRLANVGPGDEVISTPNTCTASNEWILLAGAKIVWCDVDPRTGNIDASKIESLITRKTKAVISVDWAGTPSELDKINEICNRHNIKHIEDAAQSFGAIFKGRKIGTWTDHTCFLGSTKIKTLSGNLPIKDIKIGDLVLTEDGSYQPVIDKLSRPYLGKWTSIHAGQTHITATSEHPVKVYRNGIDQWLPITEITTNDSIYVATKKCRDCNHLIPFYGTICPDCFQEQDCCYHKREKLSQIKTKKNKQTSRLIHHTKHVLPIMNQWKEEGYRVIPIVHAIPDFIAIKDNKIIAVEVENALTVKFGKLNKYKSLADNSYDEIKWITKKRKRVAKRYNYTIVGSLARIPVWNIITKEGKHNMNVYNLTVDKSHTYFARGILVHNCFSFQAIKHLTTIDGGAIACQNKKDYDRAILLRWFGLARGHNIANPVKWEGDIVEPGYKFHMNDVNATIGIESLKTIDSFIKKHKWNGQYLRTALYSVSDLELLNIPDYIDSAFWVFTILLKNEDHRAEVSRRLLEKGIANSLTHVRNDNYTLFKDSKTYLPGTDEFEARKLNIPCGWWCSRDDLNYIVKILKKVI